MVSVVSSDLCAVIRTMSDEMSELVDKIVDVLAQLFDTWHAS